MGIMTKGQKIAGEIRASKSEYITYGDSDLGMPIPKERAARDFEHMEDEAIGDGEWYECDEEGNLL